MASRDHSDVSLEAAPAAVMTIGRKRKKTMGRQKIEIKRIASEEKRQVCFSKRKDGLFKKASDLSALCGAHVAVVAFSPGGKPFSFGHPSVDALVGRFTDPAAPGAMGPAPVHSALLEEFSREEEFLAKALAAEASRKKALEAAICQAGVWTGDADVKSASPNDVLAMRSALERVHAEVAERLQEFMAEEAMMQLTASAGLFVADGGVSSHHRDQVVMDEQKMVAMGGNVDHALPFAAMMLPLPPYDHCFDLNHGPVFEVEGFYGAMACSPFQ